MSETRQLICFLLLVWIATASTMAAFRPDQTIVPDYEIVGWEGNIPECSVIVKRGIVREMEDAGLREWVLSCIETHEERADG